MSNKYLYSITALFDSPDDIIHAAEKVAEKGYKKFDVNTPYPVHGMDGAMKLSNSKLGYVALVVGLTGAITAILLTYWISAVDYPLVIGGKPFFSFPAYIPVIFEVTVLSASVLTVLAMFFFFFKMPNNSHPLHDTNYMRSVSSDRYGISIEAKDEKFDEHEVKNLFQELGAKDITPIYYDLEEFTAKPKVLEPKFLGFLALTVVIISGATYFFLNKILYMEPFSWMAEQDKVIVQSAGVAFGDTTGMRMPVEGTVARGSLPYQYVDKPEVAGENMVNPLLPSEENLSLGEDKYLTFCSPCHGDYAEGDSRLRGQFPSPPTLHSEKVRSWSDGRMYHVITQGQNVMPGYDKQMTRQERWAVVLYVRALQRSLNAKESDLQ
jgi:mono/diheme cytochrome c family protein